FSDFHARQSSLYLARCKLTVVRCAYSRGPAGQVTKPLKAILTRGNVDDFGPGENTPPRPNRLAGAGGVEPPHGAISLCTCSFGSWVLRLLRTTWMAVAG